MAVVAFLGFGSWYGYRLVGKQRAMAAAREFAEKKDFQQAAISAKRALRMDPKDLSATRLMAEMAEAVKIREAIMWRKTVAEMQPGVTQNYLDWAAAALRFNDGESAQEALSKVDAAGQNTAAYHDMAAKLAVRTGKTSEIYGHVAAAAQLEPHNDTYQLQLAAVQLGSPLPEVRKAATARAEQLTESPTVRREALRTLIQSGLAEGSGARAVRFAHEMMVGPGATFEDRMYFLSLLGKLKRVEYWWFLAQLGADLPPNDENLVTLFSWMNNNGLARLTLKWANDLPSERGERVPVCVVIAEAHALAGNWDKLKHILRFQKWGDLAYQHEALTARVAREDGDENGAQSHWNAAVTMASDHNESLAAMGRFAARWKWDKEYIDLLWLIANRPNQPEDALRQLMKKYTDEGQTRDLLRVFNRMLEINPKNLEAKNNVAYALLLLGMETERAQTLAFEAWKTDRSNPDFCSTYALSLHTKGKTDDGLKILQELPEKERNTPTASLCFGVLSGAKGMKAEAIAFLDAAEKGNLLPEEKTLASRTREKISR